MTRSHHAEFFAWDEYENEVTPISVSKGRTCCECGEDFHKGYRFDSIGDEPEYACKRCVHVVDNRGIFD